MTLLDLDGTKQVAFLSWFTSDGDDSILTVQVDALVSGEIAASYHRCLLASVGGGQFGFHVVMDQVGNIVSISDAETLRRWHNCDRTYNATLRDSVTLLIRAFRRGNSIATWNIAKTPTRVGHETI